MKPWYESKTVWLNALIIAGLILDYVTDNPLLGRAAPWVALAGGVLNIILRSLTTGPLAVTPSEVREAKAEAELERREEREERREREGEGQ